MNRDRNSGRTAAHQIRCTPDEANILPNGQRRARQPNSRYAVQSITPPRRPRPDNSAPRNVRPRRQQTNDAPAGIDGDDPDDSGTEERNDIRNSVIRHIPFDQQRQPQQHPQLQPQQRHTTVPAIPPAAGGAAALLPSQPAASAVPTVRSPLSAHLQYVAQHGQIPPVSFHEHPSSREAIKKFAQKVRSFNKQQFCPVCKEITIAFSEVVRVRTRTNLTANETLVEGIGTQNEHMDDDPIGGTTLKSCIKCFNSWQKRKLCKFSRFNDMDPFFSSSQDAMAAYASLPVLSEVEKMLIALHQPVMRIYRLKSGAFGFDGNVVNLVQDIGPLVRRSLPIPINELNIFVVRRSTGDEPTDFKDFRVNRLNLRQWLTFLLRYNKFYVGISIDADALEAIPQDGASVYASLNRLHSSQHTEAVDEEDNDENEDDNNDVLQLTGGGIEIGPDGEIDRDENVLTTGIGNLVQGISEATAIQQHLIGGVAAPDEHDDDAFVDDDEDVVHWPQREAVPIHEYRTVGLFAKTFPHLFPFGVGDPTDNSRRMAVSINDAASHFIRYAIPNNNGGYTRPFDQDPRFSHYIQDVDERQRINSQARFYIKSNPQDARRSIQELRSLNGDEVHALSSRIQRFSANVCGSDAYFRARRKELQALIEQKGAPTLWFTLSYADHHWKDVLSMLGTPPAGVDAHKWYTKQAQENPALFNEYFVKRVEVFINMFFAEKMLNHDWYWFRFEWQMRGTIHVHGMIRLKSDPGLVALAEQVRMGRQLHRFLVSIRNNGDLSSYHSAYPDDAYIVKDPVKVFEDATKQFEIDPNVPLNQQQEHVLAKMASAESIIRKGVIAEQKIIAYRDYLFTNMNGREDGNLPSDSTKDSADSRPPITPHPSSICHDCFVDPSANNTMGIGGNFWNLVDSVMRHRCYDSYCIRKNKCRFKFPRPLSDITRLVITQKKYSSSAAEELAGKLRTTSVEIIPKTNDRWLNGHNRALLEAWGGNCDFTMLIDYDATLNYVAKYGTKKEENSRGFMAIFRNALRRANFNESDDGKALIRSIFLRASAGREKTQQETSHLLLGLPMVRQSVEFVNVNLYNNSRQITEEDVLPNLVDQNDDAGQQPVGNVTAAATTTAKVISKTLIDAYANRLDSSTIDPRLHAELFTVEDADSVPPRLAARPEWESITLIEFCQQYNLGTTNGKRVSRRKVPFAVVFSPDLNSIKGSTKYALACYFNLIKFKSWNGFPESTYPGGVANEMHPFYFTSIPENIQNVVTTTWETYISESQDWQTINSSYVVDTIQRMRSKLGNDEWTPLQNELDEEGLDIDHENQEDMINLARTFLLENNINYDPQGVGNESVCEWAVDHDWSHPNYDYSNNLLNVHSLPVIKQFWAENILGNNNNINANGGQQPPPVVLRQHLRGNQVIAYDVIRYLITCPNLPESYKRGFILNGEAGCGKSFVINALLTHFGNKIKLMAPSGKASANIGGETIHKSLRIGVKSGCAVRAELKGEALKELQADFANVHTIICDEYTMISLKLFDLMDRRCKQAKNSRDSFGGMTVVLVGDPGQLPPVSGKPLWCNNFSNTNSTSEIAAYALYMQYFNLGVTLKGSNRLDNDEHKEFFEGFLGNVRNGNVSIAQFEEFNRLISEEFHSQQLNGRDNFQQNFFGHESTWYFNTNEEILKHNLKMISILGKPICRINATHNCREAFKGSDEQAQRLATTFYVCVESKVILNWNLCTKYKLCNGTTGIVKDIIFAEGESPPNNLPITIVVEFPQYDGPSFFQNVVDPVSNTILQDRSKWVPLVPQTSSWTTSKKETLERTSFPISLAWAWTPWKGQGSTNRGYCVVNPGQAEPSSGTCYVMISRVTSIKRLHIPGGITFERLTEIIRKKPGFKIRKEEEARLRALENHTLLFYNNNPLLFV